MVRRQVGRGTGNYDIMWSYMLGTTEVQRKTTALLVGGRERRSGRFGKNQKATKGNFYWQQQHLAQ